MRQGQSRRWRSRADARAAGCGARGASVCTDPRRPPLTPPLAPARGRCRLWQQCRCLAQRIWWLFPLRLVAPPQPASATTRAGAGSSRGRPSSLTLPALACAVALAGCGGSLALTYGGYNVRRHGSLPAMALRRRRSGVPQRRGPLGHRLTARPRPAGRLWTTSQCEYGPNGATWLLGCSFDVWALATALTLCTDYTGADPRRPPHPARKSSSPRARVRLSVRRG